MPFTWTFYVQHVLSKLRLGNEYSAMYQNTYMLLPPKLGQGSGVKEDPFDIVIKKIVLIPPP